MDELLLNIEPREQRAAHLKNGKLHNITVERTSNKPLTGNIYRGTVKNILENIQSAFITIDSTGKGETGFIHISDILRNTELFEKQFDMDFSKDSSKTSSDNKKAINELLEPNQTVFVQVIKEAIGSKGARLTSNISFAGRFLVLLPNSSHCGVSRKIEDRAARERLKRLIRAFEMPNDMGLICRTASRFATEEMLVEEAHNLLKQWEEVMENFKNSSKPSLLFQESGLIKRSFLNAIDKNFDRVLIDDHQTFLQCKQLAERYAADLQVELYRDKVPMFERFNVEKEIEKSLRKKIWLSKGGYLFFERTEAMYTIDINSGRSSGSSSAKDVEEALVRINLEAADEIARQLRLRNVGGLVICDFIDMRLRKNQRRVLDKLKEGLKEDTAKTTVLGMSDFGLVEMTRQRQRESLVHTFLSPCPYCNSHGMIKSNETISVEIERAVKKSVECHEQYALRITLHPEVKKYLLKEDLDHLNHLAESLNAQIEWEVDDNLHLNDFTITSALTNDLIPV